MTVAASEEWVESVSTLRLPDWADDLLQKLMDANNEGRLSSEQRCQLASLAEWSESLSIMRAEALKLLDRKPA